MSCRELNAINCGHGMLLARVNILSIHAPSKGDVVVHNAAEGAAFAFVHMAQIPRARLFVNGEKLFSIGQNGNREFRAESLGSNWADRPAANLLDGEAKTVARLGSGKNDFL